MQTYLNTVSIVTGAASGIGLALTQELLQLGGHVLLADRDAARLAAALGTLQPHGERAQMAVVDVSDLHAVEQMVSLALSRWGHIDYLFNNAGIGGTLPIADATIPHWRRIVDINLWGVIHGVHAVLPHMLSRGRGHIVNIASIAGLMPFAGQSLYNATKYAVVGFSETLRRELRSVGVRVSVACPGPVVSDIWGVPILGERAESRPPSDAVPTREAAQAILKGVARRHGLIVLPRSHRWLWRLHRWLPGVADRLM